MGHQEQNNPHPAREWRQEMPQEALQEEEMQDDEVWRRPSELVPRQLENVTTPINGAATTRHDGRWIDI